MGEDGERDPSYVPRGDMNPKSILKYFLLSQVIIVVITLFSSQMLSLRETYLGGAIQAYITNPLLYSRGNFDGNHYVYIAFRGYGHLQQAFFPLYPLTIRLFTPLLVNPYLSGVLVSSVSYFLSLVIFQKLIRVDYSDQVAKHTLLALIFFPTSFFFSFVYTEGLFFLLVILSFYFARTNRWFFAGLFGALASYTRFIGIYLVPALLIEAYLQKRLNLKNIVFTASILLGLGVFMNYLQNTVGDPLAFIHVQKYFGQGRSDSIVIWPQVIWRYIKMVITVNRSDPLYLTIIFEFFIGLIFAITSFWAGLRVRLSYVIFGLLAYITPTLTGSFTSMPRYVLVCFASFIFIGQLLSSKKSLKLAYLLVSLPLMLIFLSLFVRGYWVA